jgi:acyl-CoA dehydrogenase
MRTDEPTKLLDLEPLPPALQALRARLQGFLDGELLPAERDRGLADEGQADAELRRWVRGRSAAAGLYRLLQPAALGGGGLGPLGEVVLRETVAASGAVLGRFVLGDGGGVLAQATGAQRERYLLPVLRGELSAAFAFTDAQEGPRTTAVAGEGGYRVSGIKAYVTDGPSADLLLTVARVVDARGAAVGSGLFVVPRGAPGVSLRRSFRSLDGGLHGEFELRDVLVPSGDVIGAIGEGLPRARERITTVRLATAATACGTAGWALGWMLERARRPHRSGAPLGTRGEVQALVAQAAEDLLGARSALYAVARRAEAGAGMEAETAIAKVLATEAVARVVDRAMQLAGGAAVTEDHPLARCYRRIRGWRMAEGTTEALRLLVGRALLGPEAPAPSERA